MLAQRHQTVQKDRGARADWSQTSEKGHSKVCESCIFYVWSELGTLIRDLSQQNIVNMAGAETLEQI